MLESSTPLFESLAEDYYLVEPTSETSLIHLDDRGNAETACRPGAPINRALLKTLFTDTARHYGLSLARRV